MKKIKIFPLILIICLALRALLRLRAGRSRSQRQGRASGGPQLRRDTSKNAEEQRPPASLTKIMTGLLAIEAIESGQCRMEDIVTAGADAWTGMGETPATPTSSPVSR